MKKPAALERIRIVLSQPVHPGNIGAAARAMKTMGLRRLFLVQPQRFPHPEAQALATGASDILEQAAVCATLDDALAGTVFAVASSARRRDLAPESVDCREACRRLVAETAGGDVAVVFGTERTGLTTQEVSRCNLMATIPASRHYGSLNLAQAVQVFAYELRMSATGSESRPPAAEQLATHDELEGFFGQLERVFYASGFLDPDKPGRLMMRMRRLYGRARVEKKELNILRGFLHAIRIKVE